MEHFVAPGVHDKNQMMTKQEIAELFQVSIHDIQRWAQWFSDWLGICPEFIDKVHDETDIKIFGLINEINNQINKDVPYKQIIEFVEQKLNSSAPASNIKEKRRRERCHPENIRWRIVGHACLRYEYEWLSPLRSSVDSIINFGCWASDANSPNSEAYALLWTLEATRVVVIEKEAKHIDNAQSWFRKTREQHPEIFDAYDIDFIERNMAQETDDLPTNFDLAYCSSVLYQMESDTHKLQAAVNTMARVVKPGGWIIAVEGIELHMQFEKAGLEKEACLDGDREYTYCYRKPPMAK